MFFPVVLFFYHVVLRKSLKLQNLFLTFVSLGFYAWGEPLFLFVMFLSIIANWLFGLMVEKLAQKEKSVKPIIVFTVIFNIFILFVFKYLSFFSNIVTSGKGFNIALPIGISFFTFQAMSYVFDVASKDGVAQKNPLNVALYISFFPQLIAGPIVRYQTIANAISKRRTSLNDFASGVERFIFGFVKKMFIANNVAFLADIAFDNGAPTTLMAWCGLLAYTLQIYFDFSGYSDMAIGLGKMFGFDFDENFDYPYISKSITEFWRRWHISLGTWFRDYVYFPLGGSRVDKKSRLLLNLFIVWFLTGVWHGANWTFFLWGLLYFLLISIEKFTGFADKLKGFGHIYTLFFVMLGWALFRAKTLTEGFIYIKALFGVGAGLFNDNNLFWLREYALFLLFGIIFSLPLYKKLSEKFSSNKIYSVLQTAFICVMFIVSLSYMVKGSFNPFIYFNF